VNYYINPFITIWEESSEYKDGNIRLCIEIYDLKISKKVWHCISEYVIANP
jgi:hypothetical protein